MGSLDYPATLAQTLATFDTSPGNPACDAVAAQMCSASGVVIDLVGMQPRWQAALPAAVPWDGRQGADAHFEHHAGVSVRAAE